MQIFFRTLLAIFLAHLLADFVFQTDRLVATKRAGKWFGYLLHGLIHYFSALVLLGFFVKGTALSFKTYAVLLLLTAVHLLIERAKIRLTTVGFLHDSSLAYLADQFVHFLTVLLTAWILAPGLAFSQFSQPIGSLRSLETKWLAVPIIYVAVIFGGGYLIRYLTRNLSEGLKNNHTEKATEQLQNAGLYIGWLERFLVVTALLLQSPATVGLILTAKSIARYPEFKSERFAEYFLIGTLLSISIAIVGGAILAKLLLGLVKFS